MLVVSVVFVGSVTASGKVIYVDANAPGADDGTSWENADKYMQDALAAAASGHEIWVAAGIYKPDQGVGITAGDREATFQLINGVAICGGFPSGGGGWNDRDPVAYETILSGDLSGDDVGDLDDPSRSENSYHVVTGSGTDATTVLDGFTITAGNANGSDTYDRGGGMYSTGSSPTLTNCTFSGNAAGADPITTAGDDGGGMYSTGDPTLTNCMFSGNAARDDGGGMCSRVGSPTLTNCIFTGNSAQSSGAGMYNQSGTQKLTNCTFTGNSASPSAYGGGMYNADGSSPIVTNCTFSGNSAGLTGGIHNAWNSYLTLTNCILWANTDPGGMDESAQVSTNGPQIPLINYSCIQGWTGTGFFSGADNIGDDPLFVDANGPDGQIGTEDDSLRLSSDSPCIDAGDPNYYDPNFPADLDGNPRYIDGNCEDPNEVDMGAYEFSWVHLGDFAGGCDVDFVDFAIFALAWLTQQGDGQYNPHCDISLPADQYIDWRDLKVQTANWLRGK